MADDQSFDTIGGVNNASLNTPNLRFLAERGVRFENAYLMGSCVDAVCMPSRAMLHTGRTLHRLGGDGSELDPNHVLLGEHLARNGYFTAGVGKWHNGVASYARSFRGGGPVFFGGMNDQWNMPVCDHSPSSTYPEPVDYVSDPGTGEYRTEPTVFDRTSEGQHATELFGQHAAHFVQEYSGNEPFFLSLAFTSPHDPRTMPQRYQTMYDPDAIVLDGNVMPQHPFDNGELDVRDELLEPAPRTPAAVKRHTAEYYGMISHIDEQVGSLIDALKARGILDNTIIIYTADHGISLGRHGLMGKQNLYEHSIHIPLLISGPGIPTKETRTGLCYLLDVYPTICDLLNLSTPESVEGRSLQAVISGNEQQHRSHLSFVYRDVQRAIYDGSYKLIEYLVHNTRTTQLFNVARDPLELCDLSSHPAYSETVSRLRGLLLEQMSASDDPLQQALRH